MTTDLEAIDPFQLIDCVLSLVANAGYLSAEFYKKTIFNIESDNDLFVILTKQSIGFKYSVKENKIMISYSSRIVYTYCFNTNEGGWKPDVTNQKLAFVVIGTLEKFQNEYDRIVQSHLEQVLDLDESKEELCLSGSALALQEKIYNKEVEYKKKTFFSKFASWSWFVGGLAIMPYSAFLSVISLVVGIVYISKFRQEQMILQRLEKASDDENERKILAIEGIIEG